MGGVSDLFPTLVQAIDDNRIMRVDRNVARCMRMMLTMLSLGNCQR